MQAVQPQGGPACVAELLPSAAVTGGSLLLPDKTLSVAIEGSVDEAKALFKPPEDSQGKWCSVSSPTSSSADSGGARSPPRAIPGPVEMSHTGSEWQGAGLQCLSARGKRGEALPLTSSQCWGNSSTFGASVHSPVKAG